MKTFKNLLILIVFLGTMAMPLLVHGQNPAEAVPKTEFGPLVTCGTDTNGNKVLDDNEVCHFQNLINLIWAIIKFLVFYLAVPLAVVSIVYGGILYLSFPTIPHKKDEGKKIIRVALTGILMVLAAELIISTILNFFIDPQSGVRIPQSQSYLGLEIAYAEDTYPRPSGDNSVGSPFQILRFKSIREFVVALLDLVVQVGSPLMVVAVIYIGFLFVKARGNTGEIKAAKEAAQYTAIGIAIILGSYFMIQVLEATIKNLTEERPQSRIINNYKNSWQPK